MHELSITEGIVAGVCERVPEARVRKVTVEIGTLTALLPDALRFCFDVCAAGTRCEGAELDIVAVAARGECQACGGEVAIDAPWALCPCGAASVQVRSGNELRVRSVEVE